MNIAYTSSESGLTFIIVDDPAVAKEIIETMRRVAPSRRREPTGKPLAHWLRQCLQLRYTPPDPVKRVASETDIARLREQMAKQNQAVFHERMAGYVKHKMRLIPWKADQHRLRSSVRCRRSHGDVR